MERPNKASRIIAEKAVDIRDNPDYIVSPRGMEVREQLGGQYTVPMMGYIDNADRKVNYDFMFAEAAWVSSGSNRLSDLTSTMKRYADYSDDGVTLSGAYGPKVVDQLGYVVKSIDEDVDTRQSFLNIWRERPGFSKDIPCTTSMQFLVRDGKLNMMANMRSHDIVLGSTYDIFTFSAVANSVRLLLKHNKTKNNPDGIDLELGDLTVTAGSMHLYERHYEAIDQWTESSNVDKEIGARVLHVLEADTYEEFIEALRNESLKGRENTQSL